MVRSGSWSLRNLILLVACVGVGLPLTLTGAWLVWSAGRAGEEVLRNRLAEDLTRIEDEIHRRWIYRRSDLLLLSDNSVVRRSLRASPSDPLPETPPEYLRDAYAAVRGGVERAVFRDVQGQIRWILGPDPHGRAQFTMEDAEGEGRVALAAKGLEVRFPVPASGSGQKIGTMTAQVRTTSVVPTGSAWLRVSEAVLVVEEPSSERTLLSPPFDPGLLSEDRFVLAGETWTVVRSVLPEPPLKLVLAAPLGPYVAPFRRTATTGALVLLAVAVVTGLTVLYFAGRVARSFEELSEAAEDVAAGNIDRKVEVSTGREARRVGDAFNLMTKSLRRTLDRLAEREALAAVGEFASGLAHEVRNPLTSMRVDLQRIQETLPDDPNLWRVTERVLDRIVGLDQTVRSALQIARSGQVSLEPTDLVGPVQRAMHSAEPAFAEAGARLTGLTNDAGELRVLGEAHALERLFLNLLLNAAEALPPGGRAGVTLRVAGGEVCAEVWDDGPGIPADVAERVLEPFYSTKSEGSGLGLAVVQRIAAAHDGRVSIGAREEGGTRVRVFLPLDSGRMSEDA